VKSKRIPRPEAASIDRSEHTLDRSFPSFGVFAETGSLLSESPTVHVRRRTLSLRSPSPRCSQALRPMPISRFCHRDPTCGVVSPGAVSRFGLARPPSRLEPEVVRARRRRSISATTMRCVGTPLRVLRFLARGAGMNQFTLAARTHGCPSGACNCERCRRLLDFGFPISRRAHTFSSERERRTGRSPPSRGLRPFARR